MEAVLVFLFIGIVLFKHFGACAIELSETAEAKKIARQKGALVYSVRGVDRFLHNDHLALWKYDELGRYYKDCETGELYIIDVIDGRKAARQALANGTAKGSVFRYKNLFIDLKTMEPYTVAFFHSNSNNKERTWFYTDWVTKKKVFRKTDRQKAYEKAHPELKFYNESEIRYEDADAFSRHPGGIWTTAREEYEYRKMYPTSKDLSPCPLGGNDFDVERWLR